MNYSPRENAMRAKYAIPTGETTCPKKSRAVDEILRKLDEPKPEPAPLIPGPMCCTHKMIEDARDGD